jgi:predicted extracellular nuclease
MLVSCGEPLTATETYNLARYGELAGLRRTGRSTSRRTTAETAAANAAEQQLNDQRRILIDRASTGGEPGAIPFTGVDGEVIRIGDTLTGVVGVLSYGLR